MHLSVFYHVEGRPVFLAEIIYFFIADVFGREGFSGVETHVETGDFGLVNGKFVVAAGVAIVYGGTDLIGNIFVISAPICPAVECLGPGTTITTVGAQNSPTFEDKAKVVPHVGSGISRSNSRGGKGWFESQGNFYLGSPIRLFIKQ